MKQTSKKNIVATDKVDPDYVVDELLLASKQKKLKVFLSKSCHDKTIINYQSVNFKGVQYSIGDFIELWDSSLKSPYVGRLARIVKVPKHLEPLPFIEIEWCLKKEELPAHLLKLFGKHISVAEVFPSKITFCLYMESIKRKCVVLSVEDYGKMEATYEYYHFSRSTYNDESGELKPHPLEWKRLCSCDSPQNPDLPYVQCEQCQNWFHLECAKGYKEDKETYICEKCHLSSDSSSYQ